MADQPDKRQSDQPPAPDSVMYVIYNKDGDGATSYEIENGSMASYWFGHEFELGGKEYFTGFAYNTPQKFGAEGEDDPDPDAKVTLTQATFVKDKPGTEKPWREISAEVWIGEFGGYEKADQVDPKRSVISDTTADGRLLLAVPTTSLQSGSTIISYAILRFQPGELQGTDDRKWRYLGTVQVGEDNSAACDEGNVMPCAVSSGSLEFVRNGAGLPNIAVRRKGTEIASPGKTRELGPGDAETYVYDVDKEEYVSKQ